MGIKDEIHTAAQGIILRLTAPELEPNEARSLAAALDSMASAIAKLDGGATNNDSIMAGYKRQMAIQEKDNELRERELALEELKHKKNKDD